MIDIRKIQKPCDEKEISDIRWTRGKGNIANRLLKPTKYELLEC